MHTPFNTAHNTISSAAAEAFSAKKNSYFKSLQNGIHHTQKEWQQILRISLSTVYRWKHEFQRTCTKQTEEMPKLKTNKAIQPSENNTVKNIHGAAAQGASDILRCELNKSIDALIKIRDSADSATSDAARIRAASKILDTVMSKLETKSSVKKITFHISPDLAAADLNNNDVQ